MARRPSIGPTDAELEILNILWERGPSTVRDVCESLNRIRRTGYTTALKLMQIMTDKGLVKRDESQKRHVYQAAMPRVEVQKKLVGSLMDRLFDGSCEQLILHAIKTKRLNVADLDRIRKQVVNSK
jgi:predicted transcriptional regulator